MLKLIFQQTLNYKKIKEYKGFGGIRNEEDFLIISNGNRLLGKPKPMEAEELESLRGY